MNEIAIKENTSASMLDPERHARLLADIEDAAATARVPVAMLHHSATEFCSKEICDWLTHWQERRADGRGGLCLTGVPKNGSIVDQMMAITSAFLRNYIDARFIVINRVLKTLGTEEEEDPTVLVIPDFYIKGQGAKGATNWQMQDAYGLLLERFSKGRPTIFYVQSIQEMRKDYGPIIADHISSAFDLIEVM